MAIQADRTTEVFMGSCKIIVRVAPAHKREVPFLVTLPYNSELRFLVPYREKLCLAEEKIPTMYLPITGPGIL